MLIYEKKVEGVNHLFGTMGNVPSDSDVQLSYKDVDGNEIDNIKDFKLYYGTKVEMMASLANIPTEDDIAVNVFVGDDAIIGEDVCAVTVTWNPDEGGQVTLAGKKVIGEEITLTATANEGYEFTKWEDDSVANPRTVTLTGDASFSATFTAINQ